MFNRPYLCLESGIRAPGGQCWVFVWELNPPHGCVTGLCTI